MNVLTKWLRTYWSDNYKGPPMASDELGRKAADEIERLWADIKTQQQYLDNKDSVIKGLNEMIKTLEGDLEVIRLQRDAKRWTKGEDKDAGTCE